MLCPAELRRVDRLASTAGVEPATSGFVGRHLFHSATSTGTPVDGTRTRILRRDGPALEPVELRQHVCAVVKVLVSGTVPEQARKVTNPRPSVLETAAPPWLEPMDGIRARRGARQCRTATTLVRERSPYESFDRLASASQRSKKHACLAEAPGLSPEHSFGGEDACHRTTMMRERAQRVKRLSRVETHGRRSGTPCARANAAARRRRCSRAMRDTPRARRRRTAAGERSSASDGSCITAHLHSARDQCEMRSPPNPPRLFSRRRRRGPPV